jgi:hypothetical protein
MANKIPQQIFDAVKNAQHYCAGATMRIGRKTYNLSLRRNKVTATRHYDVCSQPELDRLELSGYRVNRQELTAWKLIELSELPASEAAQWKTWDEY